MSRRRKPAHRLSHRVAFFLVAALLLSILALSPFVLTGVVQDVAQVNNPSYSIVSSDHIEQESHSHVNLSIMELQEWRHTATIDVSGHHVCLSTCPGTDHFFFVSIPDAATDGEGLPPFGDVSFGASALEVSKEITLPITGDPIRYPFDRYDLRLAVIMQQILPDGTTQTLSPQEANGHLFLTVNAAAPRSVMRKPVAIDLNSVPSNGPAYRYISVSQITFTRPLYLQILTVFLVLLASAAAAYAVFLGPLSDLVINSGALVLGVWGIRAILLGSAVPGFTMVDLSLMVVILFLLAAIAWRGMQFLHDRGGMSLPLLRHGTHNALPDDYVPDGDEPQTNRQQRD